MKLSDFLLMLKGGAGSGNWGHSGRPGKRGGSAERTGGLFRLGLTSSATVSQRQSRSGLQKIERAEYKEGFFDEKGNYVASYETRKSRRIFQAVIQDNFEKRAALQEKIDNLAKEYGKLEPEWLKLDPNSKEGRKLEEKLSNILQKQTKLGTKMADLRLNEELVIKNAIMPEKTGNAKLSQDTDHYQWQGGITEFNKLVHPDVTRNMEVKIESQPGVRSHWLAFEKTVVMGHHNVHTVVHELGHALESNNITVSRAAHSFLQNRTKGEELQSLAKVTQISGYREDELTKPDKFADPYIGKQYGPGASEVVSMGLEMVFQDPKTFYEKDPEHFDLTVDIMNNRVKLQW